MSTIPVHLTDSINNDLEKEIYKPKDHPGRTVLRGSGIEIPERIQDAIKTCVNGKHLLRTHLHTQVTITFINKNLLET